MGLSAPTAPKGKGQDSILIKVVVGEELQDLFRELSRLGLARNIKFYLIESQEKGCGMSASAICTEAFVIEVRSWQRY